MKTEFKGAVPVGSSLTGLFGQMGGYKLLLSPLFCEYSKSLFQCIYEVTMYSLVFVWHMSRLTLSSNTVS